LATLRERIQLDLNDAVRARDESRKVALRMLTAALHNADIDAGRPIDDAALVALIQRQVKQRRESIVEFERGGRQDLADRERAEIRVLEAYLPQQADPAEIEAAARAIIAETGAAGTKDIGRVMPALMKQFVGRADGRAINEIVRRLLGS
jgi:uncharacterized protein YqeY